MKRRRTVLWLVGFLLAASLSFWTMRTREPVYHGKPISHWVNSGEVALDINREAEAAFAEMDERAVKWLIREVEWTPSASRIWVHDTLSKLGLEMPMPIHNRSEAAVALGRMKSKAMDAVPTLQRAIAVAGSDGDLALPVFARGALFRIRDEPIQNLIDELNGSADDVQWANAALVLSNLIPEASAAAPFVAEGLNRTNSYYRRSTALDVLQMIPGRAEHSVPQLLAFLEYAEPDLRQRALAILKKFGPEAVAAGEAVDAASVQRSK